MQHVKLQPFNIKLKRPQVLFLGNGLFHGDIDWDEFINSCLRSTLNKEEWDAHFGAIPYSIRANVGCAFNDNQRRKQYTDLLKKLQKENNIYSKQYPILDQLLKLPFDAVITTNYTYQIENSLDPEFVKKSDRTLCKNYTCTTLPNKNDRDSVFLLHTFNRVNGVDVWHPHGESRLKSSIVLTHDEYGRLSSEIRGYFKEISNRYDECAEELQYNTWMDYIITGDVYVLGYGANFAEFDFWWLLGRRMREAGSVGRIIFYEPLREIDKPKHFALSQSGVTVETLGFTFTDKYADYTAFYTAALKNITNQLSPSITQEKNPARQLASV